jgi:hypothetical protein
MLGFAASVFFGSPPAPAQAPPSGPVASEKSPASPAKQVRLGEFIIVEPIQCKNLTVFPVLSKSPKNEDRYVTLEEGLKAGKVQVYEVGADAAAQSHPPTRQTARQRQARQTMPQQTRDSDNPFDAPRSQPSADVNHLMVVNRSDKPLYLMPGEIIYGGQQDRCVAQECIVSADGKAVKIEVYCVEHGRWSYRPEQETQAAIGQLAGDQNLDENQRRKLTEETTKGKFVLKAGNLSKAGRVAVQEGQGQQEVWSRVSSANAASGVQAQTGAFTANYTSQELTRQIDAYVKELEKPVAGRPQVVGALVAVNGKIESVDVFGSTPLFQKVWPKLLKSHALDAAVAAPAEKPPKDAQTATLRDAEQFFRTAMQADVKQKNEGTGGLVLMKRESAGVVSFSASEKSAAPQAAGMGGGMGGFGSLHSAGYAK